MISRICNQVILMDNGHVKFQGVDVSKAIDLYYSKFAVNESNVVFDDKSVSLVNADIIDAKKINDLSQIIWNTELKVAFEFQLNNLNEIPVFNLTIFDKEQRPVALLTPNKPSVLKMTTDKTIKFEIVHPNIQLSKGIYSVNISVNSSITNEPLLRINNILDFQVLSDLETWPPFLLDSNFYSC
ncbi:MAG: hypothetical protein GYB35_13885 [Algicola sp.]|nr:hypothetical protein [Algicola sp.]